MEKNQREQMQAQMEERAKQAATVVAASGVVARDAFLATVTGLRSAGERAVVFGSLVGLVAFFLPWVTLFGALSGSGLRLASDVSSIFWAQPVSMVLCFLISAFGKDADWKRRILASRWYIVVGTMWFVPGMAAASNILSGALGFGGYLVTVSAGAVMVGGILQIGDGLREQASA